MDPEVNERFERLEGIVSGLVTIVAEQEKDRVFFRESLEQLRQGDEQLQQGYERLVLADEKTDEQLGVLIRMMDEWNRNNPRNGRRRKQSPSR